MGSKFRARRLAVAALGSALLLGLSACFYSPVTGQSERTLNDINKALPADFESTSPEGGNCGVDYCDHNMSFNSSTLSTASVSSECKRIIDWAASIGAATWYNDVDVTPFPLKGYESQAIIACTMVQMSESPASGVGTEVITENYLGETSTPTFGLRGIYSGNDLKSPFDIQFNSNRVTRAKATDPLKRSWSASISTTYEHGDPGLNGTMAPTWEEALRALPADSQQFNQILDAVGHYRLAHPQADPYATSTITRALTGLPNPVSYSLSKFADGSVHYVFIASDAAHGHAGGLCLSLTKFDPKIMGVPDPGMGYTNYSINSFEQFNAFGSWVPGKCPKK